MNLAAMVGAVLYVALMAGTVAWAAWSLLRGEAMVALASIALFMALGWFLLRVADTRRPPRGGKGALAA